MTARRTTLAGLIPVYFEAISLSDSTAVALSSTAQANAQVLYMSVETNAVRMRADGTDPALTTGVLFSTGLHIFQGYNKTSQMKFQRSTGSATVSIMSYKHD